MGRLGIAVLLLLGACSSGSSDGGKPDAPPKPPTLAQRCGDAPTTATASYVKTKTEQLYAVEAGSGQRGVVLVHGSGNGGLCNWKSELGWLDEAGLHVLAYDQSCVGESTCNDGSATSDDLRGAVAELKRRGATTVVVVGASAGGPAAIQVAADDQAGIVAAAALSPAGVESPIESPGWEGRDGIDAARALKVPLLIAAAPDDDSLEVGYLEQMRNVAPSGLTLDVLPAQAGHAQGVLYAPADGAAPSRFRARFLDFLDNPTS